MELFAKYKLCAGSLLLLIFLGSVLKIQAQVHLEIKKLKHHSIVTYSVFTGQQVYFKTTSGSKFYARTVIGFNDSLLVFADNTAIAFQSISKLKLGADGQLCRTFRKFFVRLGIAFAVLNTTNQAITGNEPIIQPLAFAVGGGLVTVGLLFKTFEYRRIKIKSDTEFKVIDPGYNRLKNGTRQY